MFTSTSSPPNVSIAVGDEPPRAVPVGDVVGVGDGLAARGPDLVDDVAVPDRRSAPVPSRATPRSLTTTCAPSRANASACSRPMPRPAPVMMTTRPRHNTVGTLPACSSGSPCSRPTRRSAWSSSRARSRSAVSRRCTSPSTRTSRRVAARRRPPATPSSREEYKRTLDPFVALGDGGRGHRTSRRRHGHLPRRAARADRDGQGGRHARPAVGRAVRVRHRLRLERGRSRAPRRRDARAAATARASTCSRCGRCGATTSASSTASTSTSRRRGRGRSRRVPGGPPVLIGGAAGPKLFAHIAEYADGWIPIGGAGVREALPELQRACEARGRDPADAADRARSARFPTPGRSSTTRRSVSPRSCCASRAAIATRCCPRLDRYAELVGS